LARMGDLADNERFDEVLMTVAGQCGGIEPLLGTFFSFLYRKTDFFHVMQAGDKMGFPEGVAEKLVLRSFRQFEQEAAAARARVTTNGSRTKALPQTAPAPAASAEVQEPVSAPAAASESQASPAVDTADGNPKSTARETQAAKAMPHIAEQADVPYNGGKTSKYSWEQTLHDVTLQVPVPAGTVARDVICVISKGGVKLKLRGAAEALLDQCFPCDARNGKEVWEKVRADESYWNLDKSNPTRPLITIYLEKERESWWKSALHGDNEIDTTKVDSERSMYEYDGETQGAIRKIMFDQDQKRKGLPTSDEMKNEDMLRKAWDAEGSPFKGTPFDPSAINFSGGNADMPLPGAPTLSSQGSSTQ